MKLGITLSGVNQIVKTLESAKTVLQEDLKTELIGMGESLRDKAKGILSEESQRRTNKRYWTGKLQQSIKSEVTETTRDRVRLSVGPDMRIAPYAEWIEIGHYVHGGWYGTKGDWWEGYHYMEKAYTEMENEFTDKIGKALRISLNKFARSASKKTVHKGTKKVVDGWGGYN